MVALLGVNALFYALPQSLKIGPDWMFLVLVAVLTIPGALFHSVRRLTLTRILGYAAGRHPDPGHDRLPVAAGLAPAAA